MRVDTDNENDISNSAASRIGTAIHASCEASITNNYKQSMELLGYPKKVIDKVVINPKNNKEDTIPIYLEKRTEKEVNNYIISGAFDICMDGKLADIKSTSTYTYIKKTNDKKYIQQASLYRWLNPTIITEDTFDIYYIFTDWSAIKSIADKAYPPNKIMAYTLNLASLAETEHFVISKLTEINKFINSTQDELPPCTDEERWVGKSVFKYYKNPSKLTRSTKNFDNQSEALSRQATDGGVGIVKEVKGTSKGCEYCPANKDCKQYHSILLNKE